MENVIKLKKTLATYKIALKAAKNDLLKEKLEAKIKTTEDTIEKLEAKKSIKKSPVTKSRVSMTNAERIAQAKKIRSSQSGVSRKKNDILRDANLPAIQKSGRRVSQGLKSNQFGDASDNKGNVYYEYRDNRLDRRPKKYARLEDGGIMAKGGKIDRKYTHFALRDSDQLILTGWDYKGVDKEDISYFSKIDLKDMDVNPSDYKILAKDSLTKRGIDPFDTNKWVYGKKKNSLMANGGMMAMGGNISTFNPMELIGRIFYGNINHGKISKVKILSDDDISIEYIAINDGSFVEKHFDKQDLFLISNGVEIDGNRMNKIFMDGGMMDDGGIMQDESDSVYQIYHIPEHNQDNPYYVWDKIDSVYVANFSSHQKAIDFIENRKYSMADGGMMAMGGKVDMGLLEEELKLIKQKYPNAKVSYFFAKDSSGKGYVIQAKEGSKIVYSSYKMADGGMMAKGSFMEDGGEIIDPKELYEKLNKAESNYRNDGGAEYNDIKKQIAENRKNYFHKLNKAESNWRNDGGAEYKRLLSMRDKFSLGGMMANGGEVGEGFSIYSMRQKLSKMFPDSFGFTVVNFSYLGNNDINYSALISDPKDPFNGLEDKDLNSKLHFPQYKRDHDIRFRIYQGGENTYFSFVLESEDGEQYIGQFGFKDQGDVSPDYITRFIAFLMEQYGLPFKVNHSVMADGGMMAMGGQMRQEWVAVYKHKEKLNEIKVISSYGNTKMEAIRNARMSEGYYGINNNFELIDIYTASGNLPMMEDGGSTKTYKEIKKEKLKDLNDEISTLNSDLKKLEKENTYAAYSESQHLRVYKSILEAKKLHLEDEMADGGMMEYGGKMNGSGEMHRNYEG